MIKIHKSTRRNTFNIYITRNNRRNATGRDCPPIFACDKIKAFDIANAINPKTTPVSAIMIPRLILFMVNILEFSEARIILQVPEILEV